MMKLTNSSNSRIRVEITFYDRLPSTGNVASISKRSIVLFNASISKREREAAGCNFYADVPPFFFQGSITSASVVNRSKQRWGRLNHWINLIDASRHCRSRRITIYVAKHVSGSCLSIFSFMSSSYRKKAECVARSIKTLSKRNVHLQ